MDQNLASDWVTLLVKTGLSIWRRRRTEYNAIFDKFGDLESLAKAYVEPDCQLVNPADFNEDEPIPTYALRSPIHEWINEFLKAEFVKRDGRNTLFVLSDAGMGKSSLLMMIKFTHLVGFWPRALDFRLMKLGDKTLDMLSKIKDRKHTVLLLDSLDEDPRAWGRMEARVRELLHVTKRFRQTIITCRTQFFPKGGRVPIEQPGKVALAGFVCNLLYLSPFSEAQINQYLKKSFPDTWLDTIKKRGRDIDNSNVSGAKRITTAMQSLRMRPMLLAYIKDFMTVDLTIWNEYYIYRTLIDGWLLREERKYDASVGRDILREACFAIAIYLQEKKKLELSRDDLDELLRTFPLARKIRAIDIGGRSLLNRTSTGDYRFSHYSIQEYLVVEGLVEGDYKPKESLRGTDQIFSFMLAFIIDRPRERLSGVDWSIIDFSDIDPPVADFSDLDLSGLDIRSSLSYSADFRGANLSGINISGKDLTGCFFEKANLCEAKLAGANLKGVSLREAQMLKADLREVILCRADLTGANLLGCDLRGAELSDFCVAGTNLTEVDFRDSEGLNSTSLSRARLSKANLQGADLRRVDLCDADLRGAVLMYADLRGANLRGADLRSADLRGADLSDAKLWGAKLSQAKVDGVTMDEKYLRRFCSQRDAWHLSEKSGEMPRISLKKAR